MLAEINAGEGRRRRRDPAPRRLPDRAPEAPRGWYIRWKAKVEWVTALFLLVLTSPLIGVAAVLVKLTSRGPAFYCQTRLGKHGRPYTIYKIRTMFQDAESGTGPCWATRNDPRVTPIGRFLRRTHLDELPQLWNVLKGDMSLVGPRPERPEFVNQLAPLIPRYRDRLLVRPGVTGLAQVQLPADTDLASVRRKLAHDLCYLQQVSLGLDLRIVLLTACDLFGIPYRMSRWLFRVPGGEAVERAYERQVAADEKRSQAQSA